MIEKQTDPNHLLPAHVQEARQAGGFLGRIAGRAVEIFHPHAEGITAMQEQQGAPLETHQIDVDTTHADDAAEIYVHRPDQIKQ